MEKQELLIIKQSTDNPTLTNLLKSLQEQQELKANAEKHIKNIQGLLELEFEKLNTKSISILDANIKCTHTPIMKKFNVEKTYETLKDKYPEFKWFKEELDTNSIKETFKKEAVYDEVKQTKFTLSKVVK